MMNTAVVSPDAAFECAGGHPVDVRRLARLLVAIAACALAFQPPATAARERLRPVDGTLQAQAQPAPDKGVVKWVGVRLRGPSPPGPHIERLKKLAPGSWLDLGRPEPDPKWGRARGRSWTANMAYAGSLEGAFLFGEGVHGWSDRKTGRYMDGLWLYDVMAHRWRNLWPGTDTRDPPSLIVNREGFRALPYGGPVPIASMVHGYQMTTWDSRRRRFMAMPNGHSYYRRALPTVHAFAKTHAKRFNRSYASPWMFDMALGRWDRAATFGRSPGSGYGDTLIYIPSLDRAFFYHKRQVWFYHPDSNGWARRRPGGPKPPFGIDSTACHDPKRKRIYLGGGSYPVAKGPNALWIYDIPGDRFVDPRPSGDPGGNSYATNYATLHCNLASDAVVLVRHKGKTRGIYAYHPDDNRWETVSRGLPGIWREHGSTGGSSGFYHPGLDIHFFHVAGDSDDNGRILAYRYRRAAKSAK